MSKTLTLVLYHGPYASQRVDIGLLIAAKALEKGYNVNIFLYMESVHSAKKGQSPKYFPNVGEKLSELAQKGAKIKSCSRCAGARGYVEGEENDGIYPTSQYVSGVHIANLRDLGHWLKNSDRVLAL